MAVVSSKPKEKALTRLERLLSMKPTPKVERLRETYLNLIPTASIDRARVETRVLKDTEGERVITRRAKVFAAIVREIPIHIYPDELLVGYYGVRPRCFHIYPSPGLEASLEKSGPPRHGALVDFGFDRPDLTVLSDGEKRELKEEILPYWRAGGEWNKALRVQHYGHNIIGYEKVLEKGFLGIKKEAEERMARLDIAKPEEAGKIRFLEGVVMAMEAAAEIGKRFAAKARELAEGEEDAGKKADLLKIAEVCDWVPANPAKTFYEAIQACYFTWVLSLWETPRAGGESIGRADQYLHAYYESDMREGRITKEEAQELIDCFLIKLNHAPPVAALTVGGVKANGHDATNPLSYMFIEGMMHTRLKQPYFSVQVHHKMPDDLLIKASQLCALGTGHPQFLNSDVMVSQCFARGSTGGPAVTLEDARSGAPIGCSEVGIPGKEAGYLHYGGPNLALMMELVMTNGLRRSDGEKVGIETGDPRQFKSFEEVQEAFHKQVAHVRKNCQISGSMNEQNLIDSLPTVYESALLDDCIESATCREEGGARYNFNTGSVKTGSTDAGDSLTAIKKVVFEDKKATMAELCDALDANFEGHGELLRMLAQAPKFGNDDDYADEEVAWVLHLWVSEFTKMENLRGGFCSPGGSPMWAYIPLGEGVGALPSGRLAGQPLCDGSSPSAGKDLQGPTAVLKSMGKIDNVEVTGGLILNMRLDPSVFENRDGVNRLADMLRTFVDQKIYHIQINVVSSDTLRAAQNEPENYGDLMVKVAGYNAFFTQLSKPVQDSIIARTAHGL